jgi:ribosome-associated protein
MMEQTQEKTLQRKTVSIQIEQNLTPFAELDENVKLALHSASEIASFTEFFIIASGSNQRQVQAIADEIEEQLKKQLSSRPVRTEGYSSAEWILMDYGDFIVHIFEQKAREFYDLERLWRDARRVELPENI